MTINLKVFLYNGSLYSRIIPAKKLFNSTMVHEVVNRGDIFAVDLRTGMFTIISGKEEVNFVSAVVLRESVYKNLITNLLVL